MDAVSEPHEPFRISVSQINTYSSGFGCPAKYRFKYVMELERITVSSALTIGLGVGRSVHGATLGEWINKWQAFCTQARSLDPEVDRAAMEAKGIDMLRALWTSGIRTFNGEPEYVISNLVIHDPDSGEPLPPLIAYLDWYDPIRHQVTELKTSSSLKPWNNHIVQLAVYRWATTRDGVPPHVRLIQINRAKQPKVRAEDILISDRQEAWVLRSISKTVGAIRAGHFPPRPSFMCRSCDFREACQDGDYSKLQPKRRFR